MSGSSPQRLLWQGDGQLCSPDGATRIHRLSLMSNPAFGLCILMLDNPASPKRNSKEYLDEIERQARPRILLPVDPTPEEKLLYNLPDKPVDHWVENVIRKFPKAWFFFPGSV